MQFSSATLYCPNCFTPNLETQSHCQQCGTWLPKRYLWVVGRVAGDDLGTIVEDRFLARGKKVIFDTQPGLLINYTGDLPERALPYLRLFPYRLHLPQLFGILSLEVTADLNDQVEDLLLLEQAPLGTGDLEGQDFNPDVTASTSVIGTAVPLLRAWQSAGEIRQLNWLWQQACLWQPLALEGVVTSLLRPELLRTEGPVFRLLELSTDRIAAAELGLEPTLATLGRVWSEWLPQTSPELATKLSSLCDQMITGQLQAPEQLVNQLEQWLGLEAPAPPYGVRYSTVTFTDQGPNRKRNEDACFPANGTVLRDTPQAMAVICDGVGGHEGGDVASGLAITTLAAHLKPERYPLAGASSQHEQLTTDLETAIFTANDLICQRNDDEHRQERERMGTTLVMGLAYNHQIHVAHVGDSRAYWITRQGCYQVTLDDDVASREVRLGFALYRTVVQHPIAGSLVQAMGMLPSLNLLPNIERFILDQDCLFLFCSDGLSDYDRVEELWQAELLPVLEAKIDLVTAGKRLIELANQKNGHDNVTVGLIHCQVTPDAPPMPGQQASDLPVTAPPAAPVPTQIAHRSWVGRPFLVIVLLVLFGLVAYLLLGPGRRWLSSMSSEVPSPLPSIDPQPSTVPQTIVPLQVGGFLELNQTATLFPQPTLQLSPKLVLGSGTVVQVMTRQTPANQAESWLQLKICSTLPTTPGQRSQLPVGQTAWIPASQLRTIGIVIADPGPDQQGKCKVPSLPNKSLKTPSSAN